MKKVLYITDREEYSEHNFIGPLFEKYLPLHLNIDIIYFSQFKSTIGRKNNHLIIPEFEKRNLFPCLEDSGIDVSSYDCVIVRNMLDVLEYVLDKKEKYNLKVGFRLSFPKVSASLERAKAENRSSLIQVVDHKVKTYIKAKMINRCDIFLPTSKEMQEVYYPDVNVKMFTIPSAIDPDRIQKKEARDDDKTVFAYIGTLTKLRNFELVLEAFNVLKKDNWELNISTNDVEYAKSCLQNYAAITDKVHISKANTKEELLDLMSKCDVGLSLLPDIDIFKTSVHLKIMDYYTGGIPSLMSNNKQNSSIFENGINAWLCDFNVKSISENLEKIIDIPKDKIREMGELGQKRLLEVRNYQVIAKKLSEVLNEL
ncbi:MAG: glycosyltransferase [Sulfurospirillaceae bacterium]|nr:glycosyltransferase [Sulfurospirillaceae bacterium]